ncbi:hypothetical protein K0M31_015005 [Melipona bicolor]|uniref:Uncharacterized protein n=1 Tax=Melipona bicolor TaxID=60889 RepID=A0AA40KFG2_9HYME|nr:hypothetical protein K0M31_015005 [Melipona bicolor]
MASERATVSYGGGGPSNLTEALSRSPAANAHTLRPVCSPLVRSNDTRTFTRRRTENRAPARLAADDLQSTTRPRLFDENGTRERTSSCIEPEPRRIEEVADSSCRTHRVCTASSMALQTR